MINARHALHFRGKRITSQRELILRIIQEQGGHLGADEIHRLARRECPRLSLSTVYRTLGLLKELGLVRELRFEEGKHAHLRISLWKLWGAGGGAGSLRDERPAHLSQLRQPSAGEAVLPPSCVVGADAPSQWADLLRAGGALRDPALFDGSGLPP